MQALAGIRIVDLTRILAGPFCTQLLSDFGAEVIKIEQPGVGDGTRQWGPPWADGESAYFLSINRNKRSITLNLKSEAGRDVLHCMLATADVLIENFIPGTLDALGLGYDALHARYPRLVYCSITGFGQTGPLRDQPGYDFAIQARGGLMSINGEVDGEPMRVGIAVADITTGLFAANAIQSALLARGHTGAGQHVDVALLDAQIGWLANVGQSYLITGNQAKRWGNAHPSIVPYQAFRSSDEWFALAVGSDVQFTRLCRAADWHDLAHDPRFATNPDRVAHRDLLIGLLAERFASRPAADWLQLCATHDVPAAPINTVSEALNDPQVLARGMVQMVRHTTLGSLPMVGPVAKLSETPARIRSAPPVLGEHTDAVLTELGFGPAAIAELRRNGAV